MANSFHYNSVDMSGSGYGCTVLQGPHPFLGPPMTDIRGVAQSFGGVARCGGYGPRDLSFDILVLGTSRSDMQTKLDAIKTALDPLNGAKTLRFDRQSDRYWYAILTGSIAEEPRGNYACFLTLPFMAADSRAYSTTTRSSPDFTITTTPQTLTVESGPTAVSGTADADCVWVIKNTSGSTVTSLILNNTTKSESVTWTGSLLNGSWLRIDTDRGVIETSTDSGANWSVNMTGVSGSFVLPTLKPGVTNSVTLTGLSAGTVTLTYTARYL